MHTVIYLTFFNKNIHISILINQYLITFKFNISKIKNCKTVYLLYSIFIAIISFNQFYNICFNYFYFL